MHYVRTVDQLQLVLQAVATSERFGFDTEFISEGTYEPVLCLIQVFAAGETWVVDPLAVSDLSRMWELLTESGREMVALAAREEIRFCLRCAGRPPAALFDPQVAAGLVGFGYPLSHTNLVRKALGVRVNGGESFTDWRRRPLSDRQIEYAADDVRYLFALRGRIVEEARHLSSDDPHGDREAWIADECSRLVERVVAGEAEERWWRVSGSAGLARRELAIVRELWRWREDRARAVDAPPRKLLRDELLVEIARRKPDTAEELYALRGLDRGIAKSGGSDILRAVSAALALPDDELPRSMRRDDPPQLPVLAQLLSVVSNGLAAQHRVDPALLATNADIQDVVRWRLGLLENEPQALAGWRGCLLRESVEGLLEGRLAVRVASLKRHNPLAVEPRPPRPGA